MTRAYNTATTQQNSGGAVNPFVVGKNKIINGDFYWNQRNFSSTTTQNTYGFDRWSFYWEGGTVTYSAQNFTLGTAPVAGYEGKSFMRLATTGQSASGNSTRAYQKIEDVRTFAGQTVTLSFWAKASSTTSLPSISLRQEFGTGGSPSASVNTSVASSVSVGTSWTRFTFTVTLPSISGKTLGSTNNNNLTLLLGFPLNSTFTVDIWGVQLEAGSVATPFEQRPIGTELNLCQRYFYGPLGTANNQPLGTGVATTTSSGRVAITYPVTLRTTPTLAFVGTTRIGYTSLGDVQYVTATFISSILGPFGSSISFEVPGTPLTVGQAIFYVNTTSAATQFSAEL